MVRNMEGHGCLITRNPPAPGGTLWPSRSHHVGDHARQRQRGRTGLGRDGARERRNHRGAGFGLPPGVDDRATPAADHFAIPHPGFRIDRLAHAAQQPQRAEIVLARPLLAQAHEGANRGGRGVEDADLVFLDDAPEAIRLRPRRRRLRTSPRSRRSAACRKRRRCGRSPSRCRPNTRRCLPRADRKSI